ncbi:HDIG domain-containing metalloprotein [Kineococcus aurantiacus]|uniref:Putative nucleotidyltransferase with HDIG domain n=1 Tax=Kineococcus aurantiacus TaxID=37633 RepID=A0A7Y9DR21_9ACTN|nr:putative nucleotidyltransferase with HDIG domain [Kineococcus aurantiacus]
MPEPLVVHGPLAQVAARVAADLLAHDGARLRHSGAVAARAGEAAVVVPAHQRALLLAAAWLHDIGYAPALRSSGFHPLDGARYLRAHGWPEPIPTLVAHHSGARFVARTRRLEHDLDDFPLTGPALGLSGSEVRALADVLTWADQTTGPDGQPVSLDERLADMLHRHGPDSPNARSHHDREPDLRAAVRRVEDRREAVRSPLGECS